MATVYVTFSQAKDHLRIKDNNHDADITLKMDQAEAMIVELIASGRTRREDPTLPLPGTPGGSIIQSAILELLAGLYEHRGDDFAGSSTSGQPDTELWNAITRKVARLRDPALA